MKNSKKIDWDLIHNFLPHEFPEDPNKYAEPELIYNLDSLRLLYGQKMRPSPASGALARLYGSEYSQHYAVDRLSTAVDWFPEGLPIDMLFTIIVHGKFKGIGIYFDTLGPDGLPWVMFHGDIRTKGANSLKPVIWLVHKVDGKNKYTYIHENPMNWKLLHDERMYTDRKFNYGRTR